MIPLVNLQAQAQALSKEIDEAIAKSLGRADFILGQALTDFENAFAKFVGAKHCVGVASGTDALYLTLKAMGIKAGDEVILPANSYIATALAVTYCGANPVLVDVDERTALIDQEKIKKSITDRTKAIIPVHLFGQPADMDAITQIANKHKLLILEDAAQAHGASYKQKNCGTLAKAAAFSFYPGKNLGAYGDGGAVTTNDDKIAEDLRLIRHFGSPKKYVHDVIGFNSRLDTLQAAILSVKLKTLESGNQRRNALALKYKKSLASLGDKIRFIEKASNTTQHVYHLFVICIQANRRDEILSFLQKEGVGASVHYPIPIHLQKAYHFLNKPKGSFPVTEKLANEMISLPLCPYLTDEDLEKVVLTLKKII